MKILFTILMALFAALCIAAAADQKSNSVFVFTEDDSVKVIKISDDDSLEKSVEQIIRINKAGENGFTWFSDDDTSANIDKKIIVMKKKGEQKAEEKEIKVHIKKRNGEGEIEEIVISPKEFQWKDKDLDIDLGAHQQFGFLSESGLLLSQKKQVTVKRFFPEIGDLDKDLFETGDTILQVNGQEVESISEVEQQFDTIKTGDPVEMRIRRDGAEKTIRFDKPKPKERILIYEPE